VTPKTAALTANTASLVLFALAAVWYAAPRLRKMGRAEALIALLWVNAFRYVALEIFSAQSAGLKITDGLRDQIAYGDLIGAGLAVLGILALRRRSGAGVALAWILALETLLDLSAAMAGGIKQEMMGAVHDVPWLILCFYVPVLWVTLGLLVWQLVARRAEPLDSGGAPARA